LIGSLATYMMMNVSPFVPLFGSYEWVLAKAKTSSRSLTF